MTSQVDCLYPLDATWQSPRVAAKKKRGAMADEHPEDVPAVAVPKAPPGSGFDMVKWFWLLGGGQAAVLSVTIGCYFSIQNKLDAHEKAINEIKNWIKKPGEFAATKGLVKPDSTEETVPMPAPSSSSAPTIASVDPNPPVAPPMLSAIPRSVHSIAPPVCVLPKTKHRFACEDASACYPESAYNPDFFDALKKSAHSDSIVVCDPK